MPDEPNQEARRAVLVVDDEVRLLRSIQLLLRERHDVQTTPRAEDAVALVEQGARFDLILCDLQMPTMSGMELAERLMALDPACRERLVFLTGGAVTAEARAFLEVTEHRVLAKPVPVEVLFDVVNQTRARDR